MEITILPMIDPATAQITAAPATTAGAPTGDGTATVPLFAALFAQATASVDPVTSASALTPTGTPDPEIIPETDGQQQLALAAELASTIQPLPSGQPLPTPQQAETTDKEAIDDQGTTSATAIDPASMALLPLVAAVPPNVNNMTQPDPIATEAAGVMANTSTAVVGVQNAHLATENASPTGTASAEGAGLSLLKELPATNSTGTAKPEIRQQAATAPEVQQSLAADLVRQNSTTPAQANVLEAPGTMASQKIAVPGNGMPFPAAALRDATAVEVTRTETNIPRDITIDVALASPATEGQTAADMGQPGTDTNTGSGAEPNATGMPHLAASHGKTVQQPVAAETVPREAPINHEHLIGQINDRLSSQEIKADGNQVRMQLRPAELGELQITLTMENQRLRVEIMADNKAVKTALLEHVDTLKEVLSRQNIAIDRFDVNTGGNENFRQFFREGARPDAQQQRAMNRFSGNSGIRSDAAAGPVVQAWQPRHNALVDVRL